MSDKFLQLRNNYCYQRREQPQQRIKTETPPIFKQNNYTYHSPRKLIKTTQASFFDHFKKFPTPKPTAYQTYLQTILENKNEIIAKQNYQPSFANIYGQKINTYRSTKESNNKKSNHQQNKTEYKISNKSQFSSPRKPIISSSRYICKTDKLYDKQPLNKLSDRQNDRQNDRVNTFEENYDDLEPWNTSDLKIK